MADEYIKKSTVLAIIGKHWRSKMYADDAIQASLDEIGYHVPSADVAPVRHGRWIKDSDGLTICSECEEVALQRVFIKLPEKIVDLQMQKSHYCPNCGCRMDGGET